MTGDGVSLNVAMGGEGPPVLLLHGFPETHLAWREVAPRLAHRHRVMCPDLRGYGQSDKPRATPTPALLQARHGRRRREADAGPRLRALRPGGPRPRRPGGLPDRPRSPGAGHAPHVMDSCPPATCGARWPGLAASSPSTSTFWPSPHPPRAADGRRPRRCSSATSSTAGPWCPTPSPPMSGAPTWRPPAPRVDPRHLRGLPGQRLRRSRPRAGRSRRRPPAADAGPGHVAGPGRSPAPLRPTGHLGLLGPHPGRPPSSPAATSSPKSDPPRWPPPSRSSWPPERDAGAACQGGGACGR